MCLNDFLETIPKDYQGYVIAQLTDKYIVDCWAIWIETFSSYSDSEKERTGEKLLEMRVFNKDSEYKLFRGSINRDFNLRRITEEEVRTENGCSRITAGEYKCKDCFDQCQFLDIDSVRAKNEHASSEQCTKVFATGGGEYSLPSNVINMSNPMIKVRYYWDKYSSLSGQARLCDWRLVDFTDEKATEVE